jgi:hypothetical protein
MLTYDEAGAQVMQWQKQGLSNAQTIAAALLILSDTMNRGLMLPDGEDRPNSLYLIAEALGTEDVSRLGTIVSALDVLANAVEEMTREE